MDFYIDFLKTKYRLRRGVHSIFQMEVNHLLKLAAIYEQEKRMQAEAHEIELQNNPQLAEQMDDSLDQIQYEPPD